jgi:hypothetical protein
VNIEEYARTTQERLQQIEQELAALTTQLTQLRASTGNVSQNALVPLGLIGGALLFGLCAWSSFASSQSNAGLGLIFCLVSLGAGGYAWMILAKQRETVRAQHSFNQDYGQRTAQIQATIQQLTKERDSLKGA